MLFNVGMAQEWVDHLPPSGEWWRSDSANTLLELVRTLNGEWNVPQEEAQRVVEMAYRVGCAEYGE